MELWLVLGIGAAAIIFAFYLVGNVMKRSTGTPEMQNISNAIKESAEAFSRVKIKPSECWQLPTALLLLYSTALIK